MKVEHERPYLKRSTQLWQPTVTPEVNNDLTNNRLEETDQLVSVIELSQAKLAEFSHKKLRVTNLFPHPRLLI